MDFASLLSLQGLMSPTEAASLAETLDGLDPTTLHALAALPLAEFRTHEVFRKNPAMGGVTARAVYEAVRTATLPPPARAAPPSQARAPLGPKKSRHSPWFHDSVRCTHVCGTGEEGFPILDMAVAAATDKSVEAITVSRTGYVGLWQRKSGGEWAFSRWLASPYAPSRTFSWHVFCASAVVRDSAVWAITGGGMGNVVLWNLTREPQEIQWSAQIRRRRRLLDDGDDVTSCLLMSDERFLFGTREGRVFIVDMSQSLGRTSSIVHQHQGPVTSMCLLPRWGARNDVVVSTSMAGTVDVYQLDLRCSLAPHRQSIAVPRSEVFGNSHLSDAWPRPHAVLVVTSNAEFLVVSEDNASITCLDLRLRGPGVRPPHATVQGDAVHGGFSAWALALSPVGRLLASGAENGSLQVYQLPELHVLSRVSQAHDVAITNLSFVLRHRPRSAPLDAEGEGAVELLSAGRDGLLKVWEG